MGKEKECNVEKVSEKGQGERGRECWRKRENEEERSKYKERKKENKREKVRWRVCMVEREGEKVRMRERQDRKRWAKQ